MNSRAKLVKGVPSSSRPNRSFQLFQKDQRAGLKRREET